MIETEFRRACGAVLLADEARRAGGDDLAQARAMVAGYADTIVQVARRAVAAIVNGASQAVASGSADGMDRAFTDATSQIVSEIGDLLLGPLTLSGALLSLVTQTGVPAEVVADELIEAMS